MCWSGEASLALATVGFTGAYVARRRGHETFRWLPLAYFSCMELLQAATYIVIGDCGTRANTVLTDASYVHIAFQPFFIHMFGLSWRPKEVRKKAAWWVWPLCGIAALVMLLKLVLPAWPGPCDASVSPLCGMDTCAYHGEWHIAWRLTLSDLDPRYLTYMVVAFGAPLIYGAWRWVLYHALLGPILMLFLTHNKDERPAVWCLMSIAFLAATHVPFLNRLLGGKAAPAHP